jgi:hypothetical protein
LRPLRETGQAATNGRRTGLRAASSIIAACARRNCQHLAQRLALRDGVENSTPLARHFRTVWLRSMAKGMMPVIVYNHRLGGVL